MCHNIVYFTQWTLATVPPNYKPLIKSTKSFQLSNLKIQLYKKKSLMELDETQQENRNINHPSIASG